MGIRWFVAAWLAGCGFQPSAAPDDGTHGDGPKQIDAAPGAWLAGYGYRQPITVTPGTTTTLVDFPLGLVKTSDAAIAVHAAGDLVVTTGDAVTVLDRELVHAEASGAFELWVRVPQLLPQAQTFYLYYGGPPVANSASVFAAYKGVWHLSDASASTASDSSPHANGLGTSGSQTPMLSGGIAGQAKKFDGTDDNVGIADPADGSLDVGTTSFSYSAWVYITASSGVFDTPVYKGGPSSTEKGYCFLAGTGGWHAKVHDGTMFVDPTLTGAPIHNRWVHLAAVLDRSAQKFTAYLDGAFADMKSTSGLATLDSTMPFSISRPDTAPFEGTVDEVRVYPGALSAEWIFAEHANLATPSFVTFGAEQAAP